MNILEIRKESSSISLTHLVIIELGTLHKQKWYANKLNDNYLQINSKIQARYRKEMFLMIYIWYVNVDKYIQL